MPDTKCYSQIRQSIRAALRSDDTKQYAKQIFDCSSFAQMKIDTGNQYAEVEIICKNLEEAVILFHYLVKVIEKDSRNESLYGSHDPYKIALGVLYHSSRLDIEMSYGFKNKYCTNSFHFTGKREPLKYIPTNPEYYFVNVYVRWKDHLN